MKTFSSLGVVGNGVVDDTAAIQTAINSNISLKIDGGTSGQGRFLISSTLTITNSLVLEGEGVESLLLVSPTFSGSILLNISPNGQLNNYTLSNFNILCNTAGPIAINLVTTSVNQYLRQVQVKNLTIQTNNNTSIASENTNTDGLACLSIDHCFLQGGIFLNNAGDSITITNNVITGGGIGVYGTFVPGAACLKIESNNITNTGGGIYLDGIDQAYIVNNEVETAVYGYNGSVDAAIFIQNSNSPTLFANQVNTMSTCTAIRLQTCIQPSVSNTRINVASPKYHVWENGCTNAVYTNNQYVVTPIGNVYPGWGTQDGVIQYNPAFLV